jgi:hypothetical protein
MNLSLSKTSRTAYLFSILALLLSSCITSPQPAAAVPQATPTTSSSFSGSTPQTASSGGEYSDPSMPIPTVSPLFLDLRQNPTPQASDTSATASSPEHTSSSTIGLTTSTNPIYNEKLDQNWTIRHNSGISVNLMSRDAANSGDYSLAVTPIKGSSRLYFTVKANSSQIYPRDSILGLSFWLYSGGQIIQPDDMSVSMSGSNAYSYWVADDTSVKNIYEPVFSETRLYYLGINRSIPPETWVKVELWLDDRIYDPDYINITGFYLTIADTITDTIFLDDIELISLETTAQATEEENEEQSTDSQAAPLPGSENVYETVVGVHVDLTRVTHAISPLIYGVTTANEEYLEAIQIPLNSWGGNPSTRYNWKHGHAWNAGRDYFFKNGNYGVTSGSASDQFVEKSLSVGAEIRLTVPTLGWVAKNDDLNTCSFPGPDGECRDLPRVTCENPSIIADPTLANTKSGVKFIQDWILHLIENKGFNVRFIAMDNEPELWGWTHYDVHPDCTTYQEVLDKYIEYGSAVREVAPEAELAGPVTSGWWFYWNSGAGAADKRAHGNEHFLPWFLTKVREHEEQNDIRILDVLDIHYYPQNVYNYEDDPATSALRLRSTRSLWDYNYIDESWINEAVALIPRMKALIDEYAPGIKLGISEWNWGGEISMSGALAVADVLGIFGKEDVYYAAYYGYPPEESPTYYAFKMYRNFDSRGSHFGDRSVWTESTEYDLVSSYAAIDSQTGKLHIMLINKDPEAFIPLQVYLKGFDPQGRAQLYHYSQEAVDAILESRITISGDQFDIELPPYSITLIVMDPN